MVHSSHLPSLENLLISSSMMFDSPQPIILKLTDKPNKPNRNLKYIFRSSAQITHPHGHNSSLSLNSTTTPPPTVPQRNSCSHSFTAMNLGPIPCLARPSSPPLKIDSQFLTKPKRKHWLLMNLPGKSCPLKQHTNLSHEKLEIRCDSKQLISIFTTHLGNLHPNTMAPLRSFVPYPP